MIVRVHRGHGPLWYLCVSWWWWPIGILFWIERHLQDAVARLRSLG